MAEEKTPSQIEVPVTGSTTFGVGSLSQPTPMWVTWIFRTEFVLNKAVMMWLASTSMVQGDNLKEIIAILTILDFVIWGLGRFVGIKKEEFENNPII